VAEVSEDPAVKSAREQYERAREAQRTLIAPATQREVAR
jgi:hypothetical protein